MPAPGPVLRYGRYGALAFEFTGTIAAGAVVGWLLDRWLGTGSNLSIVCTLIAVVGGFVRLIQTLRRFDRLDFEREP